MADENGQIIGKGKVVSFHFALRNDQGELLDSSEGGEPMEYLHGADNIVPGLESGLAGKRVGEELRIVVPPEEGYGLPEGDGPQPVSRDSFPEGVDVSVGDHFVSEDEDGNPLNLWVTEIANDIVMVDTNHPLAGETLNFEVTIVSLRDATAEELDHGHPHSFDEFGPEE